MLAMGTRASRMRDYFLMLASFSIEVRACTSFAADVFTTAVPPATIDTDEDSRTPV